MPPPPDMAYWLGQKYAILGKQAEGQYQRDIAEAGQRREETGQVAPNAASRRALEEAEAYRQRQLGISEETGRYQYVPDDIRRQLHGLVNQPQEPQQGEQQQGGRGVVQPAIPQDMTPAQPQQPPQQYPQQPPQRYPLSTNTAPPATQPLYHGPAMQPAGDLSPLPQRRMQPGLSLPSLTRPPSSSSPFFDQLLNLAPIARRKGDADVTSLKKGSANVKASPGKGGKSSKGPPKGLEAILPALMAAAQPNQMGGEQAPPMTDAPPQGFSAGAPDVMRRFVYGNGGPQPLGLPSIRNPETDDVGWQWGRGQGGPIEGTIPPFPGGGPGGFGGSDFIDTGGPPRYTPQTPFPGEPGGTPDPYTKGQVLSTGSTLIRNPDTGKLELRSNRPETQIPGTQPPGGGMPLPGPIPQGQPGSIVGPGQPHAGMLQMNNGWISLPYGRGTYQGDDGRLTPIPTGFARGVPNVQPAPNYPFGAGYLFGATAVPGQGSGTVDKVPAMLAPHEAVLNRAAADMLGRGLISALNARGVRQMGIR